MSLHGAHGRCASLSGRTARIPVLVLAMVLLMLSSAAWTPAASAHAALIATDPPADAILQTAPGQIRLSFDEAVAPLVFRIAQPDGVVADLPLVDSDRNLLVLTPPALTQQGTYALSWRVISADGHPVGGSLLFSVGTAGGHWGARRRAGQPWPARCRCAGYLAGRDVQPGPGRR